jgi:beta-galactosidase
MKYRYLLFIGLLFAAGIAPAQKLDSVRQVIKAMGYDLPRLSPVPESGKEVQMPVLSLNGTWKFAPDASKGKVVHDIQVPGEWVMQGFKVEPGSYAEYSRGFTIPAGWQNRRIKLRCDAVYSECEIFINGEMAGGHLGGFTAFETDITPFVKRDQENKIAIRVRSESIADSLSSASQYAVHPLGGISRKIFLMALPVVNCSMFHVSTTFDKDYLDAKLMVEVELANESIDESDVKMFFELSGESNPGLVLRKEVKLDRRLSGNSVLVRNFSFDVASPLKWDPEHPNLYSIRLSVIADGKVVETIEKKVGFRQIEVRGNQVFVNNMPIKLRGVCRHEVMPLRGRSLVPGQWEEDVRIFRDANVNYIRTSHYPPAPELLEACDRLGMFVEVEGPFCWAEGTRVPENRRYPALIQPELEMVNTFRSHPSVLIWSIGNESGFYKDYFSQSAALIKAIDPTRPRNFSQYGPDGDEGELEIANHHYPGAKGPEKYADSKRPITFDEYCHLNAYNRFELVTDPGIRDAWGLGFSWMWEKMYHSKGVLGGALWAAIDDSFILPDGRAVGYGTWGPIDGWRRPKPEFWHVKKVYSPVRIKQSGNRDQATGTLQLEIENRMHFTNLSECKFAWSAGDQQGTFAVNAIPGATTSVAVNVPEIEKIGVEVTDSRGVIIDQYEFTVIPKLAVLKEVVKVKDSRYETDSEIRIIRGNTVMIIDKSAHCLKEIRHNDQAVILGDALLMILPLNGKGNGTQMKGDQAVFAPFTATVKNRSVSRIEQLGSDNGFKIRVYDNSDEARGYSEYFLSDEGLVISYQYEINISINPRQVGMVFTLPETYQQLDWDRIGQWNYYPDNEIGRLKGSAIARNGNPLSGPAGPIAKPKMSWNHDQNELGTNDFRSTKMNITRAALTDGTAKLVVDSDGSQSVRCWLDQGVTNLLVADYSNMGAEGFFRSHAELIDKPLKPGDKVSGVVRLSFE